MHDSDSRHLLLNSDIDPDSNLFKDNSHLLSNCIYLTSNEFNNIPPPSSVSFSLFHINIRSLSKHFDYLSEYISTLNTSFSTIGVSETWLNDSNKDLFNIPGYTVCSSDITKNFQNKAPPSWSIIIIQHGGHLTRK